MITRLIAAALVAAGMSVVPVSPTEAVGPTVRVHEMAFSPAEVQIAVGVDVTWAFADSVAHTTTSTQGFWDSGPRSDTQSYSRTFSSAGTYPYQCTIHPMMRGTILVPVSSTGSVARGWTLRWATDGAGGTYDVQVRKGNGAWKAFKTDTSAAIARFARKGTWSVRARTQVGSSTSSWSPAVKLRTR